MGAVMETSFQALPQAWIEKLFDRMLLSFGKKFTDQWSGSDPDRLIAHWSSELAGFNGEEIKRGIAAMESLDWPPSLNQFKRMCRPAVDGLVAYYEAVEGVRARERGEMGTWSHPAIFWASVKLAFDLKSLSYSSIKDRWEVALAAEMDKGQWADIPQPALALPAPGKGHVSREEAVKRLAELHAQASVKTSKSKTDHRAWIGLVLARAKRKDPSLPAISLRFAKDALQVSE